MISRLCKRYSRIHAVINIKIIAPLILYQKGGHAFLLHGEEIKLQGALIAFVGDTPALAEVGLKKSVGPAFRKCRECMATENQMQLYVRVLLY